MTHPQLTMLGVSPISEKEFNVYHDESGTYAPGAGDRWLLHGVLFIPVNKQTEIVQSLLAVRNRLNYYSEVHYKKLRHATEGPKAQCAESWLQRYVSNLSGFCFYHCLAIDTFSPGFEHHRFAEPYHAYNYFTRVAIVGAIAWFLHRYSHIALRLYSDKKFRDLSDNFAHYVPQKVISISEHKHQKKPDRYPQVRLLYDEVIPMESNPTEVDASNQEPCELIQLTDLMTSNIAQAITLHSQQKAKINLAEIIAGWIKDTRRPPWMQDKNLHRRFSLSCFPSEDGKFYDPELAVDTVKQPKLLSVIA